MMEASECSTGYFQKSNPVRTPFERIIGKSRTKKANHKSADQRFNFRVVHKRPKKVKKEVMAMYHWFRKFHTSRKQMINPAMFNVVSAFFSGFPHGYLDIGGVSGQLACVNRERRWRQSLRTMTVAILPDAMPKRLRFRAGP